MHGTALSPPTSIARKINDSAFVPFAALMALSAVGFKILPSSLSSNGSWMWVPFVVLALGWPVVVALGGALVWSVANSVRWRASAALIDARELRAARIVGVASASYANQLAIAGTIGATVIVALRFAESPSFLRSPDLVVPLLAFAALVYGVRAAAGVERELKAAIAGDENADASSPILGR